MNEQESNKHSKTPTSQNNSDQNEEKEPVNIRDAPAVEPLSSSTYAKKDAERCKKYASEKNDTATAVQTNIVNDEDLNQTPAAQKFGLKDKKLATAGRLPATAANNNSQTAILPDKKPTTARATNEDVIPQIDPFQRDARADSSQSTILSNKKPSIARATDEDVIPQIDPFERNARADEPQAKNNIGEHRMTSHDDEHINPEENQTRPGAVAMRGIDFDENAVSTNTLGFHPRNTTTVNTPEISLNATRVEPKIDPVPLIAAIAVPDAPHRSSDPPKWGLKRKTFVVLAMTTAIGIAVWLGSELSKSPSPPTSTPTPDNNLAPHNQQGSVSIFPSHAPSRALSNFPSIVPSTSNSPSSFPSFFPSNSPSASYDFGALVEGKRDFFAAIPSSDTWGTAIVNGWRVEFGAVFEADKVVIYESDTLFQTLLGSAAPDWFGRCVALSDDIHTLLVSAYGLDSYYGSIDVYHRSTTADQFALHHTLNGEEEGDELYFGLAMAMTPNGLAVAVTSPSAEFGGVGSGSVYFYMRYTTNDPFKLINRVDGGCKNEILGYRGLAIEAIDSTLYIHAKSPDENNCIDNFKGVRTYRVECSCRNEAYSCTGFDGFPFVRCE